MRRRKEETQGENGCRGSNRYTEGRWKRQT